MQIHTPDAYLRQDGDFDVRLNPGAKNSPFAIIELSEDRETRIFIESPEDADRLIKAAVAAKDLILATRTLLAPVPDELAAATVAKAIASRTPLIVEDEHLCPAYTDIDGETVFCDREPGHPGSHHAPGPDEGSEVAWSDEAGAQCTARSPWGTACTCVPGHLEADHWDVNGLTWPVENAPAAPQGCRS